MTAVTRVYLVARHETFAYFCRHCCCCWHTWQRPQKTYVPWAAKFCAPQLPTHTCGLLHDCKMDQKLGCARNTFAGDNWTLCR